jgi:hypothetical protein
VREGARRKAVFTLPFVPNEGSRVPSAAYRTSANFDGPNVSPPSWGRSV